MFTIKTGNLRADISTLNIPHAQFREPLNRRVIGKSVSLTFASQRNGFGAKPRSALEMAS
jgi:hypothetical protein